MAFQKRRTVLANDIGHFGPMCAHFFVLIFFGVVSFGLSVRVRLSTSGTSRDVFAPASGLPPMAT